MKGEVIDAILKKCPHTKPFYVGCVGADNIPIADQYPYAMVVNTDAASQRGTHWTAMFVPTEREIEYFDSYGDETNGNIQSYLDRFPYRRKNTYPLQPLFSETCGEFCLTFVGMRAAGVPFEDIVYRMGTARNPDQFVREYVRESLL